MADSDHLVGALVVMVAVIAMGEVAQALRVLNVLFGAWLAVAPWLLTGAAAGATWNDAIVGVVLMLLSLPRGAVRECYRNWQRYIVRAASARVMVIGGYPRSPAAPPTPKPLPDLPASAAPCRRYALAIPGTSHERGDTGHQE